MRFFHHQAIPSRALRKATLRSVASMERLIEGGGSVLTFKSMKLVPLESRRIFCASGICSSLSIVRVFGIASGAALGATLVVILAFRALFNSRHQLLLKHLRTVS